MTSKETKTEPIGSSAWLAGLPQRVCEKCGGRGCVTDQRAIGDAMSRERKSARVTLREMARRLGFSAPYISDLELGRRSWNTDKISSYLKALGPANGALTSREESQ